MKSTTIEAPFKYTDDDLTIKYDFDSGGKRVDVGGPTSISVDAADVDCGKCWFYIDSNVLFSMFVEEERLEEVRGVLKNLDLLKE